MYIINPLAAAGASGTFSTHPPTRERIRILRGMGGGASFGDYQKAWSSVDDKSGGRLPASALAAAEPLAVRAPSAPEPGEPPPRRRMRDAGDMVRRHQGYRFLHCPCGMKMKIPPEYKQPEVACPRCHREHALSS
jgi:heat shock protein HtpX